MLGVWDKSSDVVDFSSLSMKQIGELLTTDADVGRLFLMELGADWGGFADVYVNSEIEPDIQAQVRPVGKELLVTCSSGQLIVGGVEDYRSSEPKITSNKSVVSVDPGNYGISCHIGGEENGEVADGPDPSQLEAAMGSELYTHYRKLNKRATLGFLWLLLFIPITLWIGWITGAVTTILIVLAHFYFIERLQRHDPKYVRADAIFVAALKVHNASASPDIVLCLRGPIEDHQLAGGRIDISSA